MPSGAILKKQQNDLNNEKRRIYRQINRRCDQNGGQWVPGVVYEQDGSCIKLLADGTAKCTFKDGTGMTLWPETGETHRIAPDGTVRHSAIKVAMPYEKLGSSAFAVAALKNLPAGAGVVTATAVAVAPRATVTAVTLVANPVAALTVAAPTTPTGPLSSNVLSASIVQPASATPSVAHLASLAARVDQMERERFADALSLVVVDDTALHASPCALDNCDARSEITEHDFGEAQKMLSLSLSPDEVLHMIEERHAFDALGSPLDFCPA